ncbi:hypothetical protein [Ralstonia pseudosolanacearum]|uniref:Uncharacterized protein n=1 Tax=Ralstonia pseudosolanacearum TaxID=1310165 RepID=A0A454TM50_9RALS|nr:hypothetical protein [Ralstonia pseudosolanacearum]RNM03209.1 hypothetical protein EGA29_19155 [Ralstonia pseudosolanacearum]
MKNRIFGRKVGSGSEMACLFKSDGASTGGKPSAPGVIDEFVVANARRRVKLLREKGIEGYVLFEGDPTPYEFTPDADFMYPAAIH